MQRLMRVSVKRRSRRVLWFLLGRMHATIVLICPCVCGCKTLRHLDQGYRQTESCMRTCAHVLYLKPRWLSVCVPAPQALLSARAAPRAATRQLVRSPFLRNPFLSLSCTHFPSICTQARACSHDRAEAPQRY